MATKDANLMRGPIIHVCLWWCRKYHQWATRSSHTCNNTYKENREDL